MNLSPPAFDLGWNKNIFSHVDQELQDSANAAPPKHSHQHRATHQDHRFNSDLWDGSPILYRYTILFRTIPTEEFSQKGVLEVVLTICSKFTGQHPSWSVISIKLLCNYIEITLPHGCFLVNLLRIVRTTFPKNTSEGLLLSAAESGRPS